MTAKAGGKKLRRCRPHKFENNKVKRGPLYKRNGPDSRLPTYEPIPSLVAYYKRTDNGTL